jgi:hypothetical protein
MDLVEPGSVQESYLQHKLVGTQDSVGGGGDQMPKGPPQGYYSVEELEIVALWIEDGALP